MRLSLIAAIGLASIATCAGPAFADDVAQICMFRCAPQLGSAGYDQCVSDCFAEEGEAPDGGGQGGAIADFTPIHGTWRDELAYCDRPWDAGWDIDASGASSYDFMCRVLSAESDGDTYHLTQSCEFYDEVEEETMSVRLVHADEIEVNGQRFKRCPG